MAVVTPLPAAACCPNATALPLDLLHNEQAADKVGICRLSGIDTN